MVVTNNAKIIGPKNNPSMPNSCSPPITPKKIANEDNFILSPISFGFNMLSMDPRTSKQYTSNITA